MQTSYQGLVDSDHCGLWRPISVLHLLPLRASTISAESEHKGACICIRLPMWRGGEGTEDWGTRNQGAVQTRMYL